VFLATWNETLVAVKLLLSTDDAAAAARSGGGLRSLPAPAIAELEKEAGLMASLRHPNIVLFLGVCSSPPAVVTGAWVVVWCGGGWLAACVHRLGQAMW
jgi:serine/threonine protein kinase